MDKVVITMYRKHVSVIWPKSEDKPDRIMQWLSIRTGVKYRYLAGGYDVTGDKDQLFDFIYEVTMEYPWIKIQ